MIFFENLGRFQLARESPKGLWRKCNRIGVICFLVSTAACSVESNNAERLSIKVTQPETQASYDTAINVWRDEQPGSDPSLHVSVQLTPRKGETPWREVKLDWLHLQTDGVAWTPKNSAIERFSDGVYQIRADGALTIEVGVEVTVVIQLTTSEGRKEIALPGNVVEAVE